MTHDCRQNPPNFAIDSLHKRKQEKALERTGREWQLHILPCSSKYTNLNKYNQVHVRGVFYSVSLKRDSGLKWVNKDDDHDDNDDDVDDDNDGGGDGYDNNGGDVKQVLLQ